MEGFSRGQTHGCIAISLASVAPGPASFLNQRFVLRYSSPLRKRDCYPPKTKWYEIILFIWTIGTVKYSLLVLASPVIRFPAVPRILNIPAEGDPVLLTRGWTRDAHPGSSTAGEKYILPVIRGMKTSVLCSAPGGIVP